MDKITELDTVVLTRDLAELRRAVLQQTSGYLGIKRYRWHEEEGAGLSLAPHDMMLRYILPAAF